MYFRKDTNRMITGSKDTGFCYMVAFFINIFSRCAFRTIPYDAERFKFVTAWFYNITVVNVNDRFGRNPILDLLKIRRGSLCRNTFIKMSGKTIYNIYLFGIFMKLIHNISQKTASGSKHTVSHISSEFAFRFRKSFGNFICKI